MNTIRKIMILTIDFGTCKKPKRFRSYFAENCNEFFLVNHATFLVQSFEFVLCATCIHPPHVYVGPKRCGQKSDSLHQSNNRYAAVSRIASEGRCNFLVNMLSCFANVVCDDKHIFVCRCLLRSQMF